jgi:hypothetical protein
MMAKQEPYRPASRQATKREDNAPPAAEASQRSDVVTPEVQRAADSTPPNGTAPVEPVTDDAPSVAEAAIAPMPQVEPETGVQTSEASGETVRPLAVDSAATTDSIVSPRAPTIEEQLNHLSDEIRRAEAWITDARNEQSRLLALAAGHGGTPIDHAAQARRISRQLREGRAGATPVALPPRRRPLIPGKGNP